MSEYRKIYFPKCPYCHKEIKFVDICDYQYGKLVGMAMGNGSDNVILKCKECGEEYRVTCTIKYNSRKM